MNLLRLYEALPPEIGNEENLELWLRNSYKIPSWDFASLSAYRNVCYSLRLVVLSPDGRMVKGPQPAEWTVEKQHEAWRQREEAQRAERDQITAARTQEALEPARRAFASQLQHHLGDRLARIEMELAELKQAREQ